MCGLLAAQPNRTQERDPRNGDRVNAKGPADDLPVLLFPGPAELETWLERNAGAEGAGLWLKIAKKGAPEPSVTYAEALEVALCFGWIDSQKRGLDETHFLQRFTPRRPGGRWSKINREKAEALIAAGSMRPAGAAEVEAAKVDGRWEAAYEGQRTMAVPEDLQRELDASPSAAEFFAGLEQPEPLRDPLPPRRGQAPRDPRAPPAQIPHHAGARREDPRVGDRERPSLLPERSGLGKAGQVGAVLVPSGPIKRSGALDGAHLLAEEVDLASRSLIVASRSAWSRAPIHQSQTLPRLVSIHGKAARAGGSRRRALGRSLARQRAIATAPAPRRRRPPTRGQSRRRSGPERILSTFTGSARKS